MLRNVMSTERKSLIMSSPVMQRMLTVYKFAFFEITLLFIIVFSQTIYKKLAYGVWEQHGLILNSSTALTAHVITAVIFVVLFLSQVMFGLLQEKHRLFAKLHIMLGRFLILFIIVFLIMALWALVARQFNSLSIELTFYMDVLFIAIFVIRGLIAVKQKRYFDHVDSMLGAFMITARGAIFRFAYIALVMLYGHSPLKIGALCFAVNLFLYFNLFLFYFLSNRWKQNRVIVLSQLLFSSLFLILVIFINKPIAHLFFIQ